VLPAVGLVCVLGLTSLPLPARATDDPLNSRTLGAAVERSRVQTRTTADRVGRIEAQLAATAVRADRAAEAVGRAVERYNGATLALEAAREKDRRVRARALLARERVGAARQALGRFAAAAYRSGGDLGGLSVVLVADGPRDLISRAAALRSIGSSRQQAVDELQVAQAWSGTLARRAEARVKERRAAVTRVVRARAEAEETLAARSATEQRVARQRDRLIRQLAAARQTTVRLERARQDALQREREEAQRRAAEAAAREAARQAEAARKAEAARQAEQARQAEEQRAADNQRGDAPTTGAPPPSDPPAPQPPAAPSGSSTGTPSGADAAIAFARAQIGKSYQWGADGPDSYDCSGLTMRAWQQGGVALPHYSVAQYERGQKVPLTALRPGDLVFYASDPDNYRSIYHVALYIGDGQMVEAPYTGENVRVSSIWRGSLFGAVRP